MIDQRPHVLQYAVISPGYEDKNGDFHPGDIEFKGNIPCRFETDGRTEIRFDDGSVNICRYVVYLNHGCRKFTKGETIKLFDEYGEMVIETRVLDFHRGQLNARLWV